MRRKQAILTSLGLIGILVSRRRKRAADDESMLSEFDPADIQDMLDGVHERSGQPKPVEERFWERTARDLPSKRFISLFRLT